MYDTRRGFDRLSFVGASGKRSTHYHGGVAVLRRDMVAYVVRLFLSAVRKERLIRIFCS